MNQQQPLDKPAKTTIYQLPKGFLCSGTYAGIKLRSYLPGPAESVGEDIQDNIDSYSYSTDSSIKDLGVIFSENFFTAAGVFTQNKVKAHCVEDNQESLAKQNRFRCLIVNSGNANACTGELGHKTVKAIKASAAQIFTCQKTEVLTASTGVIGQPLDEVTIATNLEEYLV
jgi:hypothetical protein